jgi:hypothetical protein
MSARLEVVHEIVLPDSGSCLSLIISPSKRTVLIQSSARGHEWTILNVENFAISKMVGEMASGRGLAISDHWVFGQCSDTSKYCIRQTEQSWQPFHSIGLDDQLKTPIRTIALFVNDQTVLLTSGNQMAAVNVDGKVMFEAKLPKERSFSPPMSSIGGGRFAVIENRQRGLRIEFLDMYPFPANDRIAVYSVDEGRKIFEVSVKGTSPWAPGMGHANHAAISSDGKLLAVISDETLRMFQLPISAQLPIALSRDKVSLHGR